MAKNYAGQDHRNANFRNQNLSGANFRGANLEGADFSGANLRGARFDSIGNRSPVSSGESARTGGASPQKPGIANANTSEYPGLTNLKGANLSGAQLHSANFARADLTGADLTEAKAGLQRRWMWIQTLSSLVLSGVFSFFGSTISSVFTLSFFLPETIGQITIWPGVALVILQVGMVLAIAIQGFRFEVLRTIVILIALALAFTVAFCLFNGVGTFVGLLALNGVGTSAGAFAGAFVIVGAFAGAITGASTGSIAGTFIVAGLFALAGSLFGASIVAEVFSVAEIFAVAIAFAEVVLLTALDTYLTWRTLKGDPKFFVIRSFALTFASWGGTNFHRANLSDTNLQGARLKSCNFYKATLTRANFRHTQKLDCARPGESLLQNWLVLDLLVSGQGAGLELCKVDLRGANLAGANLAGANLKQADLSEATLAGANLREVNLREAACVGTDFRGAQLTRACLEAWNIDTNTQVEGVEAQFVFLLEQPNARGDRERRPHDPKRDFEPGDFEKYFKEVLNAMQLLIRDGINPEAFRAAFQTLMEKHGITPENITGMEKKGGDVMLTVEVPANANKAQIEADFHGSYQRQLEASQARIAQLEARLEAKDEIINEVRQGKRDVMELTDKMTHNLGNLLANMTVVAGKDIVLDSPTIKAKEGSVVNTGELNLDDSTLNTGTIERLS